MKIDKALKNLIKEGVLRNPDYKYLSSGSNYQAFLVVEDGKSYVLRILKELASSRNRLNKAYKVSKFLEKNKIKYHQKVFFLDENHKFLLSEYLEGKEVSLDSLTHSYLVDFCCKFREINNLKFEDLGINIFEDSVKRISNLINYKLSYITKNKDFLDIKDKNNIFKYIKDELICLRLEYKKVDWSKRRIYFDHGDLAGANILLNKKNKELKFIDWDNAKFSKDIGSILANMFFYCSNISDSFQDKFIKIYNQNDFTGFNDKDLKQEVRRGLKLIVLSGVIWALSSAIKSKKRKESVCFEYLKTANNRLAVFKQNFGTDGGTRTHKPCGTRV